jgi:hypothetical protein
MPQGLKSEEHPLSAKYNFQVNGSNTLSLVRKLSKSEAVDPRIVSP